MRHDTLLIFPCFLEAWTEINVLTITDSSSLGQIGMSLVAAFEDDTSDQNGKPSTPPHLTSSISTIIATRKNLHLAIILVLRMYYLPRDQQFCLGLNRPALFPVHFCIFEFEYVRTCFVSIFHLFVIYSFQCAPKGSAKRFTDPFLVAWPAHNLLITLPASPPTILF